MTARQLEILQHALGVDKYGQSPKGCTPYYRNHFCAGGSDETVCRELIALGYMQQHETTETLPYFNCSVTDAGIRAMKEACPVPKKLTRSQLRLEEYRNFADAFDCTFKDWLQIKKTDWYKDMKEGRCA
jgi:hypothetical protein